MAAAGITRPGRRGRRHSAGYLNAVVAVVIVVVVAALALTASQTPPPAIAELAPSAVEQIKDAPSEQTSSAGEGGGGAGVGGQGPGTSTGAAAGAIGPDGQPVTTAPPIERARVRRCVGNPPRQIEDPQSPPCVPYWTGDNGGSTYRGVTADEIRVVAPAEEVAAVDRIEAFFNKRFELYGRRLNLIARNEGQTCEERKASAVRVADEHQAFASLSQNRGNEACYYEELARRKVIGITPLPLFTEAFLQRNDPYIWQYAMEVDGILAAMGEWACARLVGRPARFADGTSGVQPMATKTRSFGVIDQEGDEGYAIDTGPLDRELAKCGGRIEQRFSYPDGAPGNGPEVATSAVLQMQSNGITSIFCFCGAFRHLYLPPQASSQGYFPEWIISTLGINDDNIAMKTFWPDGRQRANAFGITVRPRQWPYPDTPTQWAFHEADPSYQEGADAAFMLNRRRFYQSLLLLASGIQMAGPNLNPETFARGLQSKAFPNPEHPLEAGLVGFAGDHSMTNDIAEIFWSEVAADPYGDGGPGAHCYVDGGDRRTRGRWRGGDEAFFTLACDSGAQGAPPGSRS